MFTNVGGKLKGVAIVFFILSIVVSLIIAINLWNVEVYERYEKVHPYIWVGIGALVGGIIGGWLGVLAIYAFGELVENSAIQVEQNKEIISLLKNQTKEQNGEEQVNQKVSNSHFSLSSLASDSSSSNKKSGSFGWNCSDCGLYNPGSLKVCQGCGSQNWR